MCFDVGSRVKVFWSPSGTLCPKARGLSPQHIWEQAPCVSAAWPCLSCPPKSCKCYATFQIRNVQAAADILNCWTSRIKTSEIEAVTSYSLACMLLRHWIACNRNSKKLPHGIIIRNFKSKLSNICRREAWKEWAPFSWRSFKRSWHNFAAAKDQSPRTTTQHVLRCRLQSQGLLVSQWHSLPQGTGTFPAAYLGASSLCVRCVAMLVLPPKKLQMLCNLPNQKRTSSCWHIKLLNFKNQDVRNRSSHIVYSLACMLLWHWIVCNRNSKKLPGGIIIQNVKSKLTCDAICPTYAGGRHGKSEPRSVGVLSNAHGITLLLQRTKAQEPQLSMCFAVASRVKIFWSPSGTLCPKARGLSPQHIWEQAPCVSAAWPCWSCPPNGDFNDLKNLLHPLKAHLRLGACCFSLLSGIPDQGGSQSMAGKPHLSNLGTNLWAEKKTVASLFVGQWANQKTCFFCITTWPTKTLKSQQEDFKDDQPAKSSLNKRSSSGLGSKSSNDFHWFRTTNRRDKSCVVWCRIIHLKYKNSKMSLHVVHVCVFIVVYCIRVAKKGEGRNNIFLVQKSPKRVTSFKELQGFYSVNLHQKQKYQKITKNTNSQLQIARLWIHMFLFFFTRHALFACQWHSVWISIT